MKERIDRLETKLDTILTLCQTNSKELERQHHDLYGNGKKGIMERLEHNEEEINKHSKYFYGLSILIVTLQALGINIKGIWKK